MPLVIDLEFKFKVVPSQVLRKKFVFESSVIKKGCQVGELNRPVSVVRVVKDMHVPSFAIEAYIGKLRQRAAYCKRVDATGVVCHQDCQRE